MSAGSYDSDVDGYHLADRTGPRRRRRRTPLVCQRNPRNAITTCGRAGLPGSCAGPAMLCVTTPVTDTTACRGEATSRVPRTAPRRHRQRRPKSPPHPLHATRANMDSAANPCKFRRVVRLSPPVGGGRGSTHPANTENLGNPTHGVAWPSRRREVLCNATLSAIPAILRTTPAARRYRVRRNRIDHRVAVTTLRQHPPWRSTPSCWDRSDDSRPTSISNHHRTVPLDQRPVNRSAPDAQGF